MVEAVWDWAPGTADIHGGVSTTFWKPGCRLSSVEQFRSHLAPRKKKGTMCVESGALDQLGHINLSCVIPASKIF